MSRREARIDMRVLLTQATGTDEDNVDEAIDDLMQAHDLTDAGKVMVEQLGVRYSELCGALIDMCPPSSDRTAAIRMLADSKMVAVRAIALKGRF